MKKVSKTYMVWLLISSITLSIPGPTYALVANEGQPEPNLENLVQQVTEKKKIPLRDKIKLLSALRAFRAAVKEKLQRKRKQPVKAQSFNDFKARYTLDLRVAKTMGIVVAILADLGLVAVVGALLVAAGRGLLEGGDAGRAGGMILILGIPISMYALIGTPVAAWSSFMQKFKSQYAERAYNELWVPKIREHLTLITEIRKRQEAGNIKGIDSLKQRVKALSDEIKQIENWELVSKVPPSVGILPMRRRLIIKNFIIDKYGRSARYLGLLFDLTATKNRKGIGAMLERGSIHLFDHPWAWSAVAEMYYFYDDWRPLKQLVKELQSLVDWQKWYDYWISIKRKAWEFGLIQEGKNLQSLSAEERKELVARIEAIEKVMKLKEQEASPSK